MKKKNSTIRSIKIENEAGRTKEQEGFDDMLAITLGDDRKVLQAQEGRNTYTNDAILNESFYEQTQREDREYRKKKVKIVIILIAIVALLIAIGLLAKKYIESTDGKISVNYSSSDLEGENYNIVVSELEEQGFTNISTKAQEDLITGWITKDGEVEEVDIDGITSFSSSSRFLPGAKITVTYHTFSDD